MLALLLAAASIVAPAPVTALAADGNTAAFAVAAQRRDCSHVRLWTRGRPVVRFGAARPCGPVTSTGQGLVGPVLAGQRALWLTYAGGNIREWSLWTATRSSPRPRLLRFVTRDVDAPSPIVLGGGDESRLGSLLPYAIDDTLFVLRANGARAFTWRAPARIVAADANAGEVAVALVDRRVVVLDALGRVLREERFTGSIAAVRATGTALLVHHGSALELRGTARTWTLPPPPRGTLLDAHGELAFLRVNGRLQLKRLTDGRTTEFGAGSSAALEPVGRWRASGRRVTFTQS